MKRQAPPMCLAAIVLGACQSHPAQPQVRTSKEPAADASTPSGLLFAHAPEGDVETLVRDASRHAATTGRRLVVYAGATWCEPCRRFHQAAERGELNDAFAGLTLLEFDMDRDASRLALAGYGANYIPLFALPAESGRASGQQIEGAIKGDGAVAFIVPRLKELLAR